MSILTDEYKVFKSEKGYYVGRVIIITATPHRRMSKDYSTKIQAERKLKKINHH